MARQQENQIMDANWKFHILVVVVVVVGVARKKTSLSMILDWWTMKK